MATTSKLERTVERRDYSPALRKRASWGAIFGGAFIALGVGLILGTLGLAIGATTVDPEGSSPSLSTFTTWSGVWWLGSGILALFAGGIVAGRLAGLRRRFEGSLHGLVTWALSMAVMAVLATTVVGMLISGAMRIIGATANVAARGAVAATQQVGQAAQSAELPSQVTDQAPDITWDQVWNEAQQLLEQTEAKQLQPENLREDLGDVQDQLQQARQAGTPTEARNEVEAALSKLYRSARQAVNAADREAAANVLAARTELDQQQARQRVDQWANQFQQAWQQVRQTAGSAVQQVEQTATQAAGATTDAIATAAWWTVLYLVLTALAAGLGGLLGSPRREGERVTTVERETPASPTTT